MHIKDIIEYSKADWSKLNVDNLNLYDKGDKKLDEGIQLIIENGMAAGKDDGLNVSLSDRERADLTKKIKNKIFEMQAELNRNSIVRQLDVFGIDGDDARENQLAKRALQGTYLDSDGNSLIPPENINTMAEYEPYAVLHFEEKNGRIEPVIEGAFAVAPFIVVWDSYLKDFQASHVSNEVMEELGLIMNVKLPASFIKSTVAEITHYGDAIEMEVLEVADDQVKGSDNDRYVMIRVSSCSPFEVRDVEEGKGNGSNGNGSNGNGSNGNDSNGGPRAGDRYDLILLLMLMSSSLTTAAVLIARRRLKIRS